MNSGFMIKIFVIVLLVAIVLDVVFIYIKFKLRNNETKKQFDEYLLNKYSKSYKCIQKSTYSCIYEDSDGNPFLVSKLLDKIVDNKSIAKMGYEIGNKCLDTKSEKTILSSCRVFSFDDFDYQDDFSIDFLKKISEKFLVQNLFIVVLKDEDEKEMATIIEQIDASLKNFPFRMFSRTVMFIHPANIEYAKNFSFTYPLRDGDLSEYTSHTILVDTKEF